MNVLIIYIYYDKSVLYFKYECLIYLYLVWKVFIFEDEKKEVVCMYFKYECLNYLYLVW